MEKIKSILFSNTFRQTVVTSSGTILSGILGMFFYILIARYLGPSDFGIFSVATAAIALLASVANIGIDTGIVRFVGKYNKENKDISLKFLKMGFKLKLIASATLLLLGWFLVPFASNYFFGKSELILPLRLSLLGAIGALLFSFVTSVIQAIEKFWIWTWLSVSTNLFRLLATFFIFSMGLLTIVNSLTIYILFPVLGFVIGMFFVPKFWNVKNENSVLNEFLHYNKWIALFTLIVAISSRLDTFISAKLLSLNDLGVYSVAVTLSSVIPSIILALATVVAPKLASFGNDKDAYSYSKKLQLFVFGLAILGCAVGIPLSYYFVPYLYGPAYFASFYPLVILIFAQAIFLISVPVHTLVLYYFSYPKLFVYLGVINLIVVGVGGYFMVFKYGYMGAAWVVLIGNIINWVVPLIWCLKKFNKK